MIKSLPSKGYEFVTGKLLEQGFNASTIFAELDKANHCIKIKDTVYKVYTSRIIGMMHNIANLENSVPMSLDVTGSNKENDTAPWN